MSEIVERLRKTLPTVYDCRDAADEIERLTAERDRLRKAVEAMVKHADGNGMARWPVFKAARKALASQQAEKP